MFRFEIVYDARFADALGEALVSICKRDDLKVYNDVGSISRNQKCSSEQKEDYYFLCVRPVVKINNRLIIRKLSQNRKVRDEKQVSDH